MDIYEPKEDSELLKKYVKIYSRGSVLDMGTGSGIQAEAAAKKISSKEIIAVDINPKVKDYIQNKKIKVIISDLFSKVPKKRFDTIIFNPPYLPQDPGIKDASLYGGKHGFETLARFLESVNRYLKEDGIILVVFSNLTKKNIIDFTLEKNLLDFQLLEKLKLPFFEELYCYLIKKSPALRHLNKNKVKDIKYLAHGKRGMVYTAQYKKRKIAVKVKKKSSEAVNRIQNEIKYLALINRRNIGPKLLFHNENFLAYQFVPGDFILDFIGKNKSQKNKIKNIVKKVFQQCYRLDQLKISKEEMHHPLKHIIVKYPKATLIDFERTHQTQKPQNVTQFTQFVTQTLKLDQEKMKKLAQAYKKDPGKKNFQKILQVL